MFSYQARDFQPREIDPNLANLRRPRLLMQAVRFGLKDYPRASLRKKFGLLGLSHSQTKARLFTLEAEMEHQRKFGLGSYRAARHIELLVTLLAEEALAG